jgi:ribosomal protein L4
VAQFGINSVVQKEDVGDMLRSNHIIIRDRNYPNTDGRLVTWSNVNDVTKSYSHRITHDVNEPLTKFLIRYKHMYL